MTSAYIKHINPTLINKEPLKQPLNDHKSLAENQHHGIHPRAPPMEERQKGILRQEREREENDIDEGGNQREREEAP